MALQSTMNQIFFKISDHWTYLKYCIINSIQLTNNQRFFKITLNILFKMLIRKKPSTKNVRYYNQTSSTSSKTSILYIYYYVITLYWYGVTQWLCNKGPRQRHINDNLPGGKKLSLKIKLVIDAQYMIVIILFLCACMPE